MTIGVISAACEAVYYNGRVKAGSKKLDKRDFEQLAKAAHGSIMRKLYYENRQLGLELLYFADSIDIKEYTVNQNGSDKYIVIESDVVTMPYGIGVLAVRPISEGESSDKLKPYVKAQTGADWLYSSHEFDGFPFYIRKGKRIYLYNNECVKKDHRVEVEGLFDDSQVDVPNDVAFDVINAVLGLTLKVAGFPIDPTDDQNPNVQEVKKQLASSPSI